MYPVPQAHRRHAGRILLPFPGQAIGEWRFCGGESRQEERRPFEAYIPNTHGLAGRGYYELVFIYFCIEWQIDLF